VPQLVKQVIQYRELTKDVYTRQVWELVEPVIYQYAVGDALPNLVPLESELLTEESNVFKEPLFNKKNHMKISDALGQHGLLHIQLMPNKIFKSFFVEPDSIAVDLLLGEENELIYEFYNPSPAKSLVITGTCADDLDNTYSKIKANPDDLEYRQYFIRKTLKKADYGKLSEPQTSYPEIMTAEQVSRYLQLSLSTVRNKTSTRELPSVKIASSTRYLKSDIDSLLKKR